MRNKIIRTKIEWVVTLDQFSIGTKEFFNI